MLVPWNKSNGKPRQYFKKQRHHFANKGPYSQSYGFSSSHVWMWELGHTEGWSLKNWFFCTVMLKTLEGSLDSQEIKPVNARGNQSWIFIGRSDAEAEAPILWTWCWEPTLWKRLWCCEKLRVEREGDSRGWNDWMASLTHWTWVWATPRDTEE